MRIWCAYVRFWVRPCVRRKFPYFSFSEMFGFQSTEIFRKKNGIFELAEFSQKSSEKIRKFKFGKKFGNYSKMYVNFENFKKMM